MYHSTRSEGTVLTFRFKMQFVFVFLSDKNHTATLGSGFHTMIIYCMMDSPLLYADSNKMTGDRAGERTINNLFSEAEAGDK